MKKLEIMMKLTARGVWIKFIPLVVTKRRMNFIHTLHDERYEFYSYPWWCQFHYNFKFFIHFSSVLLHNWELKCCNYIFGIILSINNTSQEYNSSPSGWVWIKFLPRVMEKIQTACDGNEFLPLVMVKHSYHSWPTATRVWIFNHHLR